MRIDVGFGVGARFKCVVRKAETNETVRETAEFSNLVLDAGLLRMAQGVWINRCMVGTGNSEPVAGQTMLDNFIASTTNGISPSIATNTATAPYYWCGRITWRFAVGTATGNLSEIALGWSDTDCWNRALIRDGAGNPTTITVLSDEYLDVFCEVRVYPAQTTSSVNVVNKLGDVISTHSVQTAVFFKSNTLNWYAQKVGVALNTSEAFTIGSSAINLSPTTPAASNFSTKTGISIVYSGASFLATIKVNTEQANFNHAGLNLMISGLMCLDPGYGNGYLNYLTGFKLGISPPISKTNDVNLTYKIRVSWGRYEPT